MHEVKKRGMEPETLKEVLPLRGAAKTFPDPSQTLRLMEKGLTTNFAHHLDGKAGSKPHEWLRCQEEKGLEKGNTAIIFSVMKQKLNCFYLKSKCNTQKMAQTLYSRPEL